VSSLTNLRAKATALVLVNWKGVFYERYLLDGNVTALEGANGAGKTTVMIAAYVVLFPDLNRLRFTNVGETGATGGDRGLWGRLGEVGRPSYAAIQVNLGNEVVLLGVHLERKTEPSLQLTPFLARGLSSLTRLADVLLRQTESFDEIPTLPEIKTTVTELGGTLQVFNSTKDYFAKLFDLGISPLRLGLDEERNKFNDMLRTSMTGGISRTLTSELRWFVFRQDTGLSDTLSRMRGSLDACRRTRTEVIEARRLETEVNGIYESALHMFAAGYFASRNLAQELYEGVNHAKQQREEAQQLARQRSLEASAINTELAALADNLEQLEVSRTNARDEASRVTRALVTLSRLSTLREELARAEDAQQRALAAQHQSTLRRAQLIGERKVAQEALAKSATGLANLQSGLDELHRRAHAHRVFRKHLDEVTERLKVSEARALDDQFLAETQTELTSKLQTIDGQLVASQRDGALLQTQRREYERALEALAELEAATELTSGDAPYVRARAVLSQLQRQELAGAVAPQLAERLRVSQTRVTARSELLARLAAIRIPVSDSTAEVSLAEAHTSSSALRGQFDALEAKVLDLENDLRSAEWHLKTGEQALRSLDGELRTLQEQHAEWERVSEVALRVAPVDKPLPVTKEALRRRHVELEASLREVQHNIGQAEQRAEAAKTQAAAIEDTAGVVNPALISLADELEGELLVRRYEEVDVDEATTIEAQLGPLVDGIVVEDVTSAIAKLQNIPLPLDHVWLVEPGAPVLNTKPPDSGAPAVSLELEASNGGAYPDGASARGDAGTSSDAQHAHVVVDTPYGKRVSRKRDSASIGRKARERKLTALRKTITQAERVAQELGEESKRLEATFQDLAELSRASSVWLAGTQAARIATLSAEARELRSQLQAADERVRTLPATLHPLRDAVERLRPLLSSASLLDFTTLEDELRATQKALDEAQHQRAVAESTSSVRQQLSETLESLRSPPPSAEELAEWQKNRESVVAERDRTFQLLESVRQLRAHTYAREWVDAQRRLKETGGLVPALEDEHETSIARLQKLENQLTLAEQTWEEQTALAQKASGEVVALQAHISRGEVELEAEGLLVLSLTEQEQRLTDLNRDCERLDAECAALRNSAQGKAAEAARLDERRSQASEEEKRVTTLQTQIQGREAPARKAWETLAEQARDAGVLNLISRESLNGYGRLPSVDLGNHSERHFSVLLERLQRASSGQKLASALQQLTDDQLGDSAVPVLAVWSKVREWLAERVPARIAQSGDPLESLSRLRDELSRLEQRLAGQETTLRGESRDVARNIEVQVRRATNQVRRLNQHLSRVSFGTIAAIRIRLDRVERTAKVLEALHDGSAQSLLFHSTLPIEEAMDEIFRRYGGGKGGGQKLLDYREYIELTVEIQRKNVDEWERANPSRLSTGEAIGVGAALMMVILTEWERDANLMRAQKTQGTLRFLFLDEANRLSRDNLGVLFELCETLELQLLIAAPEVAQVDGNTTYRLVRQVSETGDEEVIVTGRRGGNRLERDAVSPQ
jgi:chromosome partition protein MukB